METAGYSFPDHLQTSKCATDGALESRLRGRQCLGTGKGGVMRHCLRLSARYGAHEVTMTYCDGTNEYGSLPAFFPRDPVFMHLGDQNFPRSPVFSVMSFP